MPPRCLEKGQLSSRVMREILQSGGAGGWESMQGGEHVGRACREGYLRTTWPHAGTSGSLGARARAMEFADSCCTDARRFCGTFSRRASHRQPAGPRSARAGRGVRLGGLLARSQRAEVVTAPREYGQHGEQVVGQRRSRARNITPGAVRQQCRRQPTRRGSDLAHCRLNNSTRGELRCTDITRVPLGSMTHKMRGNGHMAH